MAAGYGTRLEPLTIAVPKPLVPIVNKPSMLHNIELLHFYGFREITANIHYHPEQIQNYFGDGNEFGVQLRYSYEEELMGTAGGVWRMGKVINDVQDTFVVMSSDAITDINLSKIVDFHKKKKALVTIGLAPVEDPSEFGVVITDADSKISAFQEKPKKGKALSNMVNAGIYVMEPEVLDMIPANTFYDFGKQLFPKLAEGKDEIYGYKMTEYWSDVGNLSQYRTANTDAMTDKVKLRIPGKRSAKNMWLSRGSKVLDKAGISGAAVVGVSSHIGKNVKITGHTVIGGLCIIEDGAELHNTIVWPNVYIGKNTRVEDSIIGAWCHLDSNVTVGKGTVISNRCRVRNNTNIPAGTKISPDAIV